MKTVCTSGYFNPFHIGHLALLREAKKLGGYLVVIVDNDKQVALKGSQPFMSQWERVAIIQSIKYVDKVVLSIDEDRTSLKTLASINPDIFAKGGDSTEENTPELEFCRKNNIEVIFNVGGGKVQSSSWLKNPTLK